MTEQRGDPLKHTRRTDDPRDPRASGLLEVWDGESSIDDRRVVLGLPYDGGIPSRPGARFGPAALRAALGSFAAWPGGDSGAQAASAVDLGDLALATMNGAESHARMEDAAERIFGSGARPVFIGGDHGCTGSVLRGLAVARPDLKLALINIDAHLDVREYESDAHLSSGTPFRRALETPVLSGARVAMIGIRRFANSAHYLDWAAEREVGLYGVDDVGARGAAAVAREALSRVMEGADALYLSVDLDAIDAAYAPGVSASGIGGISAREAIQLVRSLASEPRLIGADIMELSPPYDQDSRTAKLAARLLLEMLDT